MVSAIIENKFFSLQLLYDLLFVTSIIVTEPKQTKC